MSDPVVRLEGQAEGQAPGGWEGEELPAGLMVVVHPDYVIEFAEGSVYLTGEFPPLKWSISRSDGEDVDVPSAGLITILQIVEDEWLVIDTFTPDLESDVAASAQVLAGLWAVPETRGIYWAELTVTIGTDAQIRSDRVALDVQ